MQSQIPILKPSSRNFRFQVQKGQFKFRFFLNFFLRLIFITKSLFKFQSHLSQKVCQFHKGSLQKLQKQSSQFLVISELFLTKIFKIRDFEIFPNFFFSTFTNSWGTYSPFNFFINQIYLTWCMFSYIVVFKPWTIPKINLFLE